MPTIGAAVLAFVLVASHVTAQPTISVAEQLLHAIADPSATAFTIPDGMLHRRLHQCPDPLTTTTDQRYVTFADLDVAAKLEDKAFTIFAPPNGSAVLDFANQPNLIHITNGSRLAFGPGLTIRGIPSRLTSLPSDLVPYDPTGLLIFPAVTADPGAQVTHTHPLAYISTRTPIPIRHHLPTSHWSFHLPHAQRNS